MSNVVLNCIVPFVFIESVSVIYPESSVKLRCKKENERGKKQSSLKSVTVIGHETWWYSKLTDISMFYCLKLLFVCIVSVVPRKGNV